MTSRKIFHVFGDLIRLLQNSVFYKEFTIHTFTSLLQTQDERNFKANI